MYEHSRIDRYRRRRRKVIDWSSLPGALLAVACVIAFGLAWRALITWN